ncbi:sugar transferase [Caldicellulosiruptor changbaiensis]|uniref:Sugar transferase n=1 Tax=Caldicellulosiruptor changbaiensis TaxID=1222016 RepID=A0A3T0D917_9FIRM|nr:sugar transferase [Caldicellulosiruptor changbaiensis]AZT91534.1 sugar transferase [Caldicellulosiruptor changbaiensis]
MKLKKIPIFIDIIALILAFLIGIFLRFGGMNFPKHYIWRIFLFDVAVIIYFYIRGLYHQRYYSFFKDLKMITEAFEAAMFVYLLITFAFKMEQVSRLLLFYVIIAGYILLICDKILINYAQSKKFKKGIGLKNVIIIGDPNKLPLKFLNSLSNRELGRNVIGYINDQVVEVDKIQYLGGSQVLEECVEKHKVDEIIVAAEKYQELAINFCIKKYIGFLSMYPFGRSEYPYEIEVIGNEVFFRLREVFTDTNWGRVKRLIDLFVSTIAFIIALPLFLIIAIAIKIDSKGPIFYIQDRIGLHGKLFKLYKFRTMVVNADKLLEELFKQNPELEREYRINHKLKNDPRITRVGKILRKFSLDELPQLLNIIKGDMSLVGPRPYMPKEIKECEGYEEILWRVPPGLTGLWQISGRASTDFSTRLKMDEYYIMNWSFWLDIEILIKTIPAVLKKDGAY